LTSGPSTMGADGTVSAAEGLFCVTVGASAGAVTLASVAVAATIAGVSTRATSVAGACGAIIVTPGLNAGVGVAEAVPQALIKSALASVKARDACRGGRDVQLNDIQT
jgi:hypothetical protein